MTSKKKEDVKVTCNVGTDPPEPLDFDPFDMDGYGRPLQMWQHVSNCHFLEEQGRDFIAE